MTTKAIETDMSDITVVEFENAVHFEETYLSSELSDGPPFTIHGVALGNDDVTKGKSGIKKKWPAEELKKAADSLQGTNLVTDHENSVHGVVGRVTKAGYKDDTGIVYEAELYDEDLANKIKNGLLEVSVRGLHKDVDDLEESEEGALVVEDIEFRNLSIVSSGAASSNTLEIGEHAELSAAELASFTEDLEELETIEPGMWVTTGDKNGITISQVQDGEIEVDIYEEQDGQWRSIEQTTMLDVGSLDEWDVDEEDIGPVENDKEEEENSDEGETPDSEELIAEGDKVQWDDGAAHGVVVERKTDGCFNEKISGDVEVCADDDEAAVLIEIVKNSERTGTMVAHKEGTLTSSDFTLEDKENEDTDSESGSANTMPDPPNFEEGDMVQWQVAPSMKGQIVRAPNNQDIVMVEVMQEQDGELTETGFTITAGYSDLTKMEDDESDEDKDSENEEDSESVEENSAFDQGDFIRWDDNNNQCHGQIIGIEQDGQQMVAKLRRFTEAGDELDETACEPIQGLNRWDTPFEKEIYSEESESLSDDSGATVNDLITVLSGIVENSSTVKDVPTENAEADHESMGSMENMFNQFMEAGGSPDSTLSDFIDWLNEQEELAIQPEGADDILDNPEAIRRFKENDAAYMAFVWHDDNAEELEETFDDYPEAAKENAQMALDAREETDNPNDCGTDIGWKRANQLASGEALSRDTIAKMSAFNRHRSNSEKSDEEGKADCGWMMWKAWGGDEGVDWAQRKLDQIEEENTETEELQDYEMHTPEWSGTTESDWSTPDMEDFDTDDLSEIADHFLISTTGFPPENFTDLKLPVVEPNGDLNVNALAAVKGGRGVTAVEGLSSDMEDEIINWVDDTANEEFDRDWDMDEEEMMGYIEVQSGPTQYKTVGGVRVLPGDDLRDVYTGESISADSLTQHKSDIMNEEIEEKLGELDDPVAVEAEELQQLRNKADRLEELSDNIEALTERTEILDEVERETVEELRDGDDPVVVESAHYEELQSEAEQVKGVYAAQLSEHYDAFDSDELVDKFSIEELREKYESQFGSIEELAGSSEAEPKSQDPSEEELEESSDNGGSEEELSEEISQKQEEIRQKLDLVGGE